MAKYLDKDGLTYFWEKIKPKVLPSSLYGHTWVMIGDSYGYGSGNNYGWINKLITILGLTEGTNLFSTAIGGAGFNTNLTYVFGNMASTLAAGMTTAQKNSITRVLICGGANDRSINASSLTPMIVSQINSIKSLFPNAQICVGMIAGCIDNGFTGGNAPRILDAYKAGAVQTGSMFLDNVQYALHDRTNLSSDNIHPTSDGYLKIANAICQAFNGGFSYSLTKHTQLFTLESGWSHVTDPTCYATDICNDIATFTLVAPLNLSHSSTVNLSLNNHVTLGTLAGKEMIGQSVSNANYNRLQTNLNATIAYNGIIKNLNCIAYITDECKLRIWNVDYELSGGTSGVASVNRIIIPTFSISVPTITC